jgi:alpha-amylase
MRPLRSVTLLVTAVFLPAVVFSQSPASAARPGSVTPSRVSIGGVPSTALYAGTLLRLEADAWRKGSPDKTRDASLFWSSSDVRVAWVAEDGTVALLKPGTATIAVSFGGVKDSVTIRVEANPVTKLTLSGDVKDAVAVGEVVKLSATAFGQDDAPIADARIQYLVSVRGQNATNASISENGAFSATEPGLYTVLASFGKLGVSKTIHVRSAAEGPSYGAGNVSKIEIENPEYDPYVGTTMRLSAKVDDVPGGRVSWTSSDPKIAVVDGQGMISFLSSGKVTMTATRGGQTASKTFSAQENPTAKMVMRIVGRDVFPNDTIDLRTEVWGRGGMLIRKIRVNYSVVSSAQPGAVSVLENGRFTATQSGVYTVVAEVGGLSDMTTIVVRDRDEAKRD